MPLPTGSELTESRVRRARNQPRKLFLFLFLFLHPHLSPPPYFPGRRPGAYCPPPLEWRNPWAPALRPGKFRVGGERNSEGRGTRSLNAQNSPQPSPRRKNPAMFEKSRAPRSAPENKKARQHHVVRASSSGFGCGGAQQPLPCISAGGLISTEKPQPAVTDGT
ncbi:hypothetical protein [Devosia sp. DBB001]|nr:hypothetical protein [Devosia sp. DBB001]